MSKTTYGTEPYLYSDKIVCFMDFLGFREIIGTLPDKDAVQFIIRMETILEEVVDLKDNERPTELSSIMSNSFSDCVCYSMQLTSGENTKNQIWSFLDRISHVQANLTQLNVVVRGAIVIDRHYSSQRLIFSKALAKAYFLESATVKHPIIYIDETVLKVINEIPNPIYEVELDGHEEEKRMIRDLIYIADNKPILHYLSKYEDFTPLYGVTINSDFFVLHKKMIEDGFTKNATKVNVQKKYKWLSKYHNEYFKTLPQFEGTDKKLFLVDEALLKIPLMSHLNHAVHRLWKILSLIKSM